MNPAQPPLSDEEEYNSTEEDPSQLVSPRRPAQSPSVSPRVLLRPDPPTVEEVLDLAGRQLRNLPARRQQQAALAAPIMPATNYDKATADADDEGAFGNARDVRLPFNKDDVKLWFSLIESKMHPE